MLRAATVALFGLSLVVGEARAADPLAAIPARGDDADRKSKNGRLEVDVGEAKVVVSYGRPMTRGRKVWGGLVQYGKVWRTGADEATTFTTTKPVKVQGQRLDAGTYALFTLPGKSDWTLIFNRQAKQWGAYKYDPKLDALRVETKSKSAEMTESLSFEPTEDGIRLRWGKVSVPIALSPAD